MSDAGQAGATGKTGRSGPDMKTTWPARPGRNGCAARELNLEPIAKSTVTSIQTACGRKQRTGVVLYWRPIVPGWNDQPAIMAHVLDTGRHADAIVFTGYHHKLENAAYLREQGVPLPYGEDE
jgi:hypothetical protein